MVCTLMKKTTDTAPTKTDQA